jgi:integrase
MPKKELDKYIKAFGDHLDELDYSCKTKQGYTIAVRQLLCDIVDVKPKTKRKPQQIYNLKYIPEQLTLKYLKYYTKRVKESYEPATQRIKLCAIKYYLKYIREEHGSSVYDDYESEKIRFGSRKDILKARPREDKYLKRLTDEEIDAFFEVSKFNPRDHAIFKMFYHTAQRVHTIVNLNVEDIDFEPQTSNKGNVYYNITIKYNKGIMKQPIVIPVQEELVNAVLRYLDNREEPDDGFVLDNYGRKLYNKDALFLNGTGQRFSEIGVLKMQKRYATKLGIKRSVFNHLWRHTAITKMHERGMSEAEIKRISGHAKQSSALRTYINPSIDDIISKSQSALSRDEPQPKPPQEPPTPKTKPTDTYIASPQDNKVKELELKLIDQLANGEISNKVYNDAMQRLQGISKLNGKGNNLVGYE